MITPFGPPNHDLDRLNTILDAQVAGKRAPAPDPASDSDADALAATARLIAGQPLDTRELASAETLDVIWRNVMHAHAIPDSTTIRGARPGAVRSTSRASTTHVPYAATASPWLSVAAMVVLLLGIVGGAWSMRGGNGGGEEPIRLAAVAPLGTPESESRWVSWITPEECTLEPMRPSEVTTLQNQQAEKWPIPTYGPVLEPSQTDAEAAATAARALTSCFMYRSDGSYSSAPYIWRYTSPHSPLFDPEASVEHQEGYGREVSRDLSGIMPSNLILRTSTQPDEVQENEPFAFLPEQAVQFPDGRIGIPLAYLIPEGVLYEVPKALYTTLFVFSDESGSWLLDDSLSVCVGECEAYIDGGSWMGNNIWVTDEGSPMATPVASPVATPEG